MYCVSDELSVFQRTSSEPLIFHPFPLSLSAQACLSCLPSIFLSSLSSGDRDYLGASRHSISPGGKVTHSALQLASDSCRLKLEVFGSENRGDSEPLSATQPKALCAASHSSVCPTEPTERRLHWGWKKRRSLRVPVVYPSVHCGTSPSPASYLP